MRTVTIVLEEDSGSKASSHEHDLECIMTMNGRHYHNSLKEVFNILATWDNGRCLTKEQRKMLEDLREKCAPCFKELHHDKRR